MGLAQESETRKSTAANGNKRKAPTQTEARKMRKHCIKIKDPKIVSKDKMGLFGKSKPADPKELVNQWSKQLRKEGYSLDRQIRQIQRSEQAAVKSIKDAAKKGDSASAKVLAREVVHSRKAVSKIYTAKANLKSVEMQMKGQAAQVRVAGSLSKSADTMKAMQQLVKIPEIQKTMQEMSKEMMKVFKIQISYQFQCYIVDEFSGWYN